DVPDERLETVVDRMIAAAKARGLVRMNEVLLYVNLGVVFGERFLQRRELEWLRQIMDDEAVGPPLARVRKAHAEAVKRLEAKS
ncbi:MAG: hypothetical protein JST92_25045, partial [Deltaproteobacteria bacterium]|nr:hypothetical protein [Deltaproteobacteria bacterium]